MGAESFSGGVPADRLYDPGTDMWVCRDADGTVVVGATSFGLFLAGEVIAFTAKPVGAEFAAGRGLGTVETGKTVLAVRSPLSLRLLAGNEAAETQPAIINRDPYGAGWMVRGEALDWAGEAARLVGADAYRAHVLAIDPHAAFDD